VRDGTEVVSIEVTEEAAGVLLRALELGGVEGDGAGIRLRAAHGLGGGLDVQVKLADGPETGEEVLEVAGLTLYVDPQVTRAIPHALVALEPQHDVVVVRPADPPGIPR
jgi:hypothetical protein